MKKRISGSNNSRNAWFLGSSSFLNDAGGDMIAPILPFYITALGGGGIAIGLLSGLREGLSSIFKIFGGWISDRTGKRKHFVFLGYFFSFVFKFLIGLANSWQHLIWFVSLERFGKFRDAPRDAIISQSNQRGKNFGIVQMLDTAGAIFGTSIVLILFWKFSFSFKTIIFIAAAVSLLSLFPLIFVKEPKFKKTKKTLIKGISELDKRLKYFVLVASVFALANFGMYMFLLLIAQKITGNIIYPLILYILFNITFAAFTVPFGRISDKVGRKKILYLGYVLFLAVTFGFIFLEGFLYLFVLFPLYGLVYAATNSNQRALASDFSGDTKGTAMGFFHMVTGLITIPGGLIAGFLWNVNSDLMFYYLSAVGFVALILLVFVKEKKIN